MLVIKSTLQILFFQFFFRGAKCEKLLLIGDSVDRHSTEEWCVIQRSRGFKTEQAPWGPTFLSDVQGSRGGRWGTFSCKTDTDSVAYAQVYGSNATEPYYWTSQRIEVNKEFEGTKARINLILSLYLSQFGTPDRIVFQTIQWDAAYLINVLKNFDEIALIARFKQNIIDRISEISQIVPDSVDVGIRTAPRSAFHTNLINGYNNAMREIASERNISLYDYDLDIWSSVNFNFKLESHLFRDTIHPKFPYSATAADKMLGRQYSSLVSFKNGNKSSDYYNERFDTLSNLTIVHLWRDREKNATFFINIGNSSRNYLSDDTFLFACHIGPSDIKDFKGDSNSIMQEGATIPSNFYIDGTVYNATLDKAKGQQLFIYTNLYLHLLVDDNMVAGIGKKKSEVMQLDDRNSTWLSLIFIGVPVFNEYSRTSDWMIRHRHDRQVYLIKNGMRTPVKGEDEVEAMNMTWNDVVVVSDRFQVEIIPLNEIKRK